MPKTTSTNNGSGIKALSSKEIMKQRSGMFIGNNNDATHLWIECIDNARDECLSGYCNRIDVSTQDNIDGSKWYITRDYGRGIPIRSPNFKEDVPIVITTNLFSGGKFDDSDLYSFSSGLHGVGIKAVNFLSSKMIITTLNPEHNNHIIYFFENGDFKQKREVTLNDKDNYFSTEIRFIPSSTQFQSATCNEDTIIDALKIAKYGLGDNTIIKYNNQPIEDTLLDDFIKDSIESIEETYTLKSSNESCKINIALYEDFDNGKLFKGIVNLLRVDDGTHIQLCKNLLINKLYEIAQKNKKHLQDKDLLIPIRLMCNLKIKHIGFAEQTKRSLTTPKSELQSLIEPLIDNLIKKNKDFFDKIIDKAEEYRVNITASKQLRKSKIGSKAIKVEGLRDCSDKDNSNSSIFLVEGLSAGTTLIKCRDPKIHAILALRGKVLNVAYKATTEKILSNQVIQNIANALGYQLFKPMDPDKCRYNNIMLLSDSDYDGKHINCLLVNVFYKLFPELIKAGKVYIIQPPLYGTRIKNQFIPIFTEEDKQLYPNSVIQRYKGLGEMDSDELYYSAIDPNTRSCLQLNYTDFDIGKLWSEDMGHLKTKEYKFT